MLNIPKSFADRLTVNAELRNKKEQQLTFGNTYLDDVFDGIYSDDLIIFTAKTGGGKTELVSQIAYANAVAGKKVTMLALEAYKGEIEDRILYRSLANAFFLQKDISQYKIRPNFQSWLRGKQDELLKKFEPECIDELKNAMATFSTYYRESNFTVDDFENLMSLISSDTDLVVLDHLHFMDFTGDNENQELKMTVKKIRQIQTEFNKPVVLVCQLRKRDKRTASFIPDLEDIHGSSEVVKIATKIIAAAPATDIQSAQAHIISTYFGILKNRTDGSRCRYIGLCGFDLQKNEYTKNYKLGERDEKDKFKEIEQWNYPQWARKLF